MNRLNSFSLTNTINLHHLTPHIIIIMFSSNTAVASRPSGTKVCRYNWHSAGSLGWPFPVIKCKKSNKTYGSDFIKQHSETVMGLDNQNADCSLKMNLLCYLL